MGVEAAEAELFARDRDGEGEVDRALCFRPQCTGRARGIESGEADLVRVRVERSGAIMSCGRRATR